MRHSFTILTGSDGKCALAADKERSPAEERTAFEDYKTKGLPDGIAFAMLIDTDNRGNVLTLDNSGGNAAPETKSKSKDESKSKK